MKKQKDKDKIANDEKLSRVEDMQLNTCSTYDCTGLIPAAITNDDEAKAYEELYPYITPSADPDNGGR